MPFYPLNAHIQGVKGFFSCGEGSGKLHIKGLKGAARYTVMKAAGEEAIPIKHFSSNANGDAVCPIDAQEESVLLIVQGEEVLLSYHDACGELRWRYQRARKKRDETIAPEEAAPQSSPPDEEKQQCRAGKASQPICESKVAETNEKEAYVMRYQSNALPIDALPVRQGAHFTLPRAFG